MSAAAVPEGPLTGRDAWRGDELARAPELGRGFYIFSGLPVSEG